jgi:hypothetical protein
MKTKMNHRVQKQIVCCVLLLAGLCLAARAAERQITIEPGAKQVKRYEKIEFSLSINPMGENPYDPSEIDFEMDLVAPSGKKITLPAFYYQDFERRRLDQSRSKAEWLYPASEPVWKARFAPSEVGTYSCTARLRDRGGVARSASVTFESLPSTAKGFVRVSSGDPRFLAFDDGAPFFPIGQNVAFVKDAYDTEDIFQKMAAQGANYARVWTCCEDWAMAIEARKSVWARSWGWNPPIVALPGSEGYHSDEKCVKISGQEGAAVEVSPTRRLALRPETKYVLSGVVRADGNSGLSLDLPGAREKTTIAATRKWTPFKIEFTTAASQWWLSNLSLRLTAAGAVLLRSLSLTEAAGGPELLWEADVNRPVRGYYNQPDCFMLDKIVEAAERNGLYLQLTLLTRDHYMSLLAKDGTRDYDEAIASAKRLLRYAVARWGYSTHVAVWEYFNEMNPGLPTDRFYSELGDYLEQSDPYRHLRATSTWGPSKKDWNHPKLDTADMHYYMRPATGELFKDAVESVRQRAKFFLETAPNKPRLFSEFGLTEDNWQRGGRGRDDKEFVHLHDGLWTSALSGLSCAVLPWFWEELDRQNMYHHYKPLAAFVADIPFTTGSLRAANAAVSGAQARVVGLQGKACAYLWLSNRQATWWNIGVDKATPGDIGGATLTLEGLEPGTYRVLWWDTWKGVVVEQQEVGSGAAKIQLKIPSFSRDIACKVVR